MKVLGISPLDKDASASLVEDGKILYAAGEERFSRKKQHAGFPYHSLEAGLSMTGTDPKEVDVVAYPFLTWDREQASMEEHLAAEQEFFRTFRAPSLQKLLREAEERVPERGGDAVHGLKDPNQRLLKTPLKRLFYLLAGGLGPTSRKMADYMTRKWINLAVDGHKRWQRELEAGLDKYGLKGKLKRYEHHLSHAANSYLNSGFERALIVTIDGYGTGLAGSISLGEGGKMKRLHNMPYPYSLGTFYETVTSSLGFNPDRHAGKIVGLAAYGDPKVLADVLLSRFERTPGSFRILQNFNDFFSRHLAARFPMIDVAAAYQHVLEVVVGEVVKYWVDRTGCDAVVLSGGVTANVKMNQRIHEVEGVKRIFVYPNMGDGGCGTGLATYRTHPGGVGVPFETAYLGPEFSDDEIRKALDGAGLEYGAPENLAQEAARRIHQGQVVARFDGRMEYGPRALGNRSILYHAREPEVNQWLNTRLGRTEFMPFAPVTSYEDAERFYRNLSGAMHAAQFMTITFDCTGEMVRECPAAVHVDDTARPQLITRDLNPGYYDIVKEYEKLSGVPTLINTSFNMHEEPIVCTPKDAIRAFLLGHLDGLVIGKYLVPSPETGKRGDRTAESKALVSS